MKVTASLNNLRIAPRKVRLVTRALVGVTPEEALLQLSKLPKRSSAPLSTLIASALANATNNFGLDRGNLFIQDIRVGDGLTLKRWLPRAHGRATPLLRRGSNVCVILEERIEGLNRTSVKKAAPKKAETKTAEESETENKKEAPQAKAKTDLQKKQSAPKPASGAQKKVFQRKAV